MTRLVYRRNTVKRKFCFSRLQKNRSLGLRNFQSLQGEILKNYDPKSEHLNCNVR